MNKNPNNCKVYMEIDKIIKYNLFVSDDAMVYLGQWKKEKILKILNEATADCRFA